jgi:hypothetical protein
VSSGTISAMPDDYDLYAGSVHSAVGSVARRMIITRRTARTGIFSERPGMLPKSDILLVYPVEEYRRVAEV